MVWFVTIFSTLIIGGFFLIAVFIEGILWRLGAIVIFNLFSVALFAFYGKTNSLWGFLGLFDIIFFCAAREDIVEELRKSRLVPHFILENFLFVPVIILFLFVVLGVSKKSGVLPSANVFLAYTCKFAGSLIVVALVVSIAVNCFRDKRERDNSKVLTANNIPDFSESRNASLVVRCKALRQIVTKGGSNSV